MKDLLPIILTCLSLVQLAGQRTDTAYANTPVAHYHEFFKYVPLIDANTPDWAVMMYEGDPNVYEIQAAYEAYFDVHTFKKSIHTQNYKHWLRTIYQNHYLTADGRLQIPSYEQERADIDQHMSSREAESLTAGAWTALGPFETQAEGQNLTVTWQSNIYTFDQSVDNPNVVYAGTETGGLFRSNDKGLNWISIGDDLILGGIGSIKTDPSDANTIYVGQGRYLYKSTNGGNSWTEILNINGLNIRDIHINPTDANLVLLATQLGIYRSTNGGDSFTPILNGNCYDIEVKPNDHTVYYIAKENTTLNTTEVWKSTDAGLSFTARTAGWFVPTNGTAASNGGARLAVTAADPNYVYCALLGSDVSYAQDNNWVGVYKSTDAAESWSLPAGDPGGPYNSSHWCLSSFHPTFAWGGSYDQGFYNLGLAVSATDPEALLVGCLNLFKSEDGGASYEQWGGYGGGPGWQHPDIQEIEINGSDVWVASDGGLNLYTADWSSLDSRMKGINSSEYWGFDSGWNEDVLVGGRYHNGNGGYYENYPDGTFIRLGGAESPTGYVNPGNNRSVYHSDISAKRLPTSINGAVETVANLGLFPNQAVANESKSELVADPRCYNHLYMGVGNSLMKSEDGGVTFSNVNSFGSNNNIITGIEIARNNPEVIYVAQRLSGAATIWKSTDGGDSWSNLMPSFSGSGGGGIFISVDQANENILFAGLSNGGSNSNKVFKSTNGGNSWTNLTTAALDGYWVEDIMMQSGTSGGVYLATNRNIFYRNNSHADWQDFSDGAPAKMANMTLKPFYRDGKIRSATYNRGIWESDFFETSSPIVQPMVDKTHSSCTRDVFYFDDYSVLNHAGATWSWSFSPAPESVSSTTVRNPEVVFGEAGTYTATLTVTQGGFSDSESITVTVDDGCNADTVPGNALVLGGDNTDYVVSDPIDVQSNSFTISMWIKRNGDQADWAGLFFQRGSSTVGLNFGTDNELRYHPGWPWNSGLVVPDNEWTHVALVVTPSNATIYMNGVGAVHNSTQPVANLNAPLYIGADPNFGTRRFNGLIDEVSFYNRAMAQAEIRELMHLTRDPSSDPDLLRYYQFNEVSGIVYDRAGIKHGTLSGGAARQTSTGPFGGGRSHTIAVNSGGPKAFTDAELEMVFPANGPYPDGDVVVSKINNAPDQYAGVSPMPTEGYWIINNFGDNQSFAPLESMRFAGLLNVMSPASSYNLHKRGSNDDGNSWGLGIAAASSATATTLTFNQPGVSSFSQFIMDRSSALPVELLQFGAEAKSDKTVRLFWKTTNEIDNDRFEIEWSTDGRLFASIGSLPSRANASSDIVDYTFIHSSPARGFNYYRLKQIDLDGSSSYSKVRQLLFEALADSFVIFPNPLSREEPLYIKTYSNQSYQFSVWNAKGHRLLKRKYQGDAQLSINQLNAGVYFYKIEVGDTVVNGRLMVGK